MSARKDEALAPDVRAVLAYVVVAVLFDWGNRGRVHPAYAWGAAALVSMAALTELLAVVPPFAELAGRLAN